MSKNLKGNISVEFDMNYIKDNKAKLLDDWNDVFPQGEEEPNTSLGLYTLNKESSNEVRLDPNGDLNLLFDDGKFSAYGWVHLEEDDLIKLYDSIKEYFENQMKKMAKVDEILGGRI